MTAVAIRREHLVARYDASGAATLDELVPLTYERTPDGLPAHIRAASALRRFGSRLIVVQDDVNALAVIDAAGVGRAIFLPAHVSGSRVFDDTLGNKHEKLDLEAGTYLPDGRFVALGSGSAPPREQLVVWDGQSRAAAVLMARPLYRALRGALGQSEARLNIEGAIVNEASLRLFHRGNDLRVAGLTPQSAFIDVELREFLRWLDGGAAEPSISSVTTVDLGEVSGVPFGFTDAVALDRGCAVVLACAEDSACAISDGAVLGCRVGLLDTGGLRTVDVYDTTGEPTLLKLEGIERRPGSSTEFDVAADVDRPAAPAMLGRLVWNWR